MHYLALHLGRPADELAQSMSEAEFRRWMRYAGKHGLPLKRIELMLAQLSMLVVRVMGGSKTAKVSDFMLAEPEELPENVTRLDAVRAAIGFNPRKKKA